MYTLEYPKWSYFVVVAFKDSCFFQFNFGTLFSFSSFCLDVQN